MVNLSSQTGALAATADFISRELMCIARGEQVVITHDDSTDPDVVDALYRSAVVNGAVPAILGMRQVPYQGALADPYIPEPVAAAVQNCDVWFDCAFPYLSGSGPHVAAMEAGRTRMLSIPGLDPAALVRLFNPETYERVQALQAAADDLIAGAVGASCRITTPAGTDVTFTMGKPKAGKPKVMTAPGTYTPIGSAMIQPEPDSVIGVIALEAAFHEYLQAISEPLIVEVDGEIRSLKGRTTDSRMMARSLRRASGDRGYGRVVHFSMGLSPYTHQTFQHFVEDIRVAGNNAVGFGIPWWEPGGGENHPDGIITQQSLWLDGEAIILDGRFQREALAGLEAQM